MHGPEPDSEPLVAAVDTPDVEQTFSERETSVAISPSESQEQGAARFNFIGSVELLPGECACWLVARSVPTWTKVGILDQIQVSRSLCRADPRSPRQLIQPDDSKFECADINLIYQISRKHAVRGTSLGSAPGWYARLASLPEPPAKCPECATPKTPIPKRTVS